MKETYQVVFEWIDAEFETKGEAIKYVQSQLEYHPNYKFKINHITDRIIGD